MRQFSCNQCNKFFESEDALKCPFCGSENLTIHLKVCDRISLNESISGKVKEEGIRKPRKEFFYGADYSYDRKKYVDKTRIIDRENNRYYENVEDKDLGEVIYTCDEPLTDHFGHGSAKKKSKE